MKKEQQDAIEKLKKILKPDQVIYIVLRRASRSGMRRWLDVYYITDNIPMRITYKVAQAIGCGYDSKMDALKIDACGLDVGHHIAYELSGRLSLPEHKLKHMWM